MNAVAAWEWLTSHATPVPGCGCWLWTGASYTNGYGHAKVPKTRRTTGAHRLSWTLFNGVIPKGMDVCHKCDTRACVNPAHLFIGTRGENIRDCVRKGRHWHGPARRARMSGENSSLSKLTRPLARDMREAYSSGATQAQIARAFSVSTSLVSKVVRNEAWRA